MCEITIIIPVYNVEKYIERCLISALEQDFSGSYEILIIDDCGSDGSMLLVEEFAKTHPKGHLIRIVRHLENRGLGEASNTGIKEAKGKYVYFLDSDDWISNDCLSLLYNEAEKYQNEVTVAGMKRVTASETLSTHGFDYFHYEQPAAFIMMAMDGRNVIETRWNKLLLLAFLQKHNIYCAHRWHEDIFFDYQIKCHCSKMSLIPNFTYYYFVNEKSITLSSSLNRYKIEEFAKIYQAIIIYSSQNRNVPNVYDYYLAIIRGVMGHVACLVSTQEDVYTFSKITGSFIKVVPSVFSLKLRKNKSFYLLFKYLDSFKYFYKIGRRFSLF